MICVQINLYSNTFDAVDDHYLLHARSIKLQVMFLIFTLLVLVQVYVKVTVSSGNETLKLAVTSNLSATHVNVTNFYIACIAFSFENLLD